MEAWKKAKLHEGWAGLILCMMWEAAQGSSSKWTGYFSMRQVFLLSELHYQL